MAVTNDERAVLMIAAEGGWMTPIGRWEQPIRDLASRGLMQKHDAISYVITPAGMDVVQSEERQRDDK